MIYTLALAITLGTLGTGYGLTLAYLWRSNARQWEANSNGWRDLYFKVRYGQAQPTHSPLAQDNQYVN